MKVLITGGCGFLGSNLAAYYLERGEEVVVADALFRKGSTANLAWLEEKAGPGQFHFVQLDLADAEGVMALFRRHGPFDFICHVGGQVAMTTSLAEPRRDLLTNVVGTFNVLEATRALSPEALIAYSSTNKVYGDLEWLRYEELPTRYNLPDYPRGLDEALPLDFSTPYGCSKGAADQYTRDWARVYGLKTVVFRHSSIYGGRQFASFDQGWVGWFCQKAVEQRAAVDAGKEPPVFTIAGTGKQVRDVLHARDLIALYDAAYVHREAAAGQIFNIGGGMDSSLSLLELLSLLAELVGLDALKFEQLPRRQSDQDFFVADISKAERLLGWKPALSSREGVRAMLEWTREMAE
ncbi:MAG TPA: GDP-mannose 4,6-dehydratase [Chthoniobacterales bacterium]